MDYLQISSKENNLFKKVKKLKHKKYRDKEGLFIAEGNKVIELNKNFEHLFIREGVSLPFEIESKNNIFTLDEKLFNELSSQSSSQGFIGVYKKEDFNIQSLKNDILVLDGLQDPGNIGTIIRTFEAAGFTDIILSKGSGDIYNEKVVRSSMGAIFNIRAWYLETDEIIKLLKDNSFHIISTALNKNSINYNKMCLKNKNAIVLGSEGNGISETLLENSDETVIIPINGSSESLNVGIAAGIVIYKYLELKEI